MNALGRRCNNVPELHASAVVFLAVDGAARSVLFTVDFRALRRRQVTTVCSAIAVDLAVDLSFTPLQVGRLARREGAILDAFCDSLLLTCFASIHLRAQRGSGEGKDEDSEADDRVCFQDVSRVQLFQIIREAPTPNSSDGLHQISLVKTGDSPPAL